MNINEVYHCLKFASPKLPMLLVGPPGVGKSDIVAKHAEATGQHFLIEHPITSDPTDVKGLPFVVEGQACWLPIGGLKQIADPSCPPTIVLVDDLGQAPLAVQAAYMQLLQARRLGDFPVASTVTFLACTNRASDNAGVRSILSALVNRVLLVDVEANAKIWADWAIGQPDISPILPAYARFKPDLFATKIPNEIKSFCTPRSAAQLGRLISVGCDDTRLWGGLVDHGTAAEILAYSKVFDKLPDIGAILDNPKGFKVPKNDPGLMHAVAILAARSAMTNPVGLIGLAEHFGTEWGVALVSDTVAISPEFKAELPFKQWAVRHKEVLL